MYIMSKLIDLTGQKFGRLTVLHKDTERITKNGSYWICQCECGNIKSIRSAHLRKGDIQSCGCYNKEHQAELKTENLVGQKFGMLEVIEKSNERSSDNRIKWICICDCGNLTTALAKDLKSGHTQSCGCRHKSFGELEIEKILQEYQINFIEQYRFVDFKNRIYDFAIFDKQNNLVQLLEFDGQQHFSFSNSGWNTEEQMLKTQEHDRIKNEWCKNHNIPIIRIPYWVIDDLVIDDLLLNSKFILNQGGVAEDVG